MAGCRRAAEQSSGVTVGQSGEPGQAVEAQLRDRRAAWCGGKNLGFGARQAWVLILLLLLSF